MSGRIKSRMVPYRILAYLLYKPTHHTDMDRADGWLLQTGPGELLIRPGAAAKHFRIPRDELVNHIKWLQSEGILEYFRPSKMRGYYHIKLTFPTNLNEMHPEDASVNQTIASGLVEGTLPIPREITAEKLI